MRKFTAVALVLAAAGAGVLAVVVAGHLWATGTDGKLRPRTVAQPAPTVPKPRVLHVPTCVPGSLVRLDGASAAHAVTVRRAATAFRAPGSQPFARFERLNVNGVPTVFSVLGARLDRACKATWYHVQLPLRPNGSTGWVSARAVAERTLHVRIVVDLSERRVTLYRGRAPVLATTAAIGTASTPTPTGRYYVNQKLVPADPSGPFGSAALGISAFSPVLQDWSQGGPIAIHGTNQAELLGSAVSHGCIRIANDAIERLWKLAPTGTPVLIRI